MLTTGQAAKFCSVQPDTVLKWIKRKRIPAVRTAGGHYRIDRRDLEPLLRKAGAGEGARIPSGGRVRQPLRCWEFLSDRGVIRDECKQCVVYRVRAAWCFQVADMEHEIGHAKQFCQNSCLGCAYYRRVKGLATNVLVITQDSELIERLAGQHSESVVSRFARDAYEASAVIADFRPAFVVVDQELLRSGEGTLVECLACDRRIPGAKIMLGVPRGMTAIYQEAQQKGVAGFLEKPFDSDHIAAAINSFPVESALSNNMMQ